MVHWIKAELIDAAEFLRKTTQCGGQRERSGMFEKYLRIAVVQLLGMGAMCIGADVGGDACELGAFRVHAIKLYEALNIPNANSLIECRLVPVDLHLYASETSGVVRLEQRLGGGLPVWSALGLEVTTVQTNSLMDGWSRIISLTLPPSYDSGPVSVTQRSDMLPAYGTIGPLSAPIPVFFKDNRDLDSLDVAFTCSSSFSEANKVPIPPPCRLMLCLGSEIPSARAGGKEVAYHGHLPAVMLPFVLTNSLVLYGDSQRLDRMIVDNILEAEKTGGHGKRDFAVSRELLNYIVTYPLTQDGYDIFAILVSRTPGNTEKRRLANLGAMATDTFGERAAPVMTYYTACHLYRALDYDGALTYIDRYESQYSSNPERVRILKALCLTQMNRAEEAIAILKKLQTDMPDSPLRPDIMFMEGWIWFQNGNKDQARSIMEVLVKKFHGSRATSQAKQILDELNEER